MEEIWKAIEEGTRYEVSNLGRVRNDRGHIMSPYVINSGYELINLVGTKQNGNLMHRLVAREFIPNPENKPHINHLDANRLNNRADNLEWVTPTENMADVIARGKLNTHSARKAVTLEKKIVQQDKTTGEVVKIWNSIKEAAETLELQDGKISMVCSGKRKTTGGFKWKYLNEDQENTFKTTKVVRTDSEGTQVVFGSISKAADSIGVNRSTLGKHMKKETIDNKLTYGGYVWEKC